MAQPYRRPNSPFYWYDIVVDGKRERRSTKRTTLKEARAVQQEVLRQGLDRAQFASNQELTLREALFDHYLPTKIGAASYVDLERYCKTICGDRQGTASIGGSKKFHEVTSTTLLQYRVKRLADGMSEQSVDHELKCISAAYNIVKEDYRVRVGLKFPMARVKGKPRPLSLDEETALLEELEPLRVRRSRGEGFHYLGPLAPMAKQRQDNYDLAICLLDTGCRYSEIAKLTWAMVDCLDFSWVHIFRDKVENQGRLLTTSRMKEVLRRRRAERSNSPYVFPSWDHGEVDGDAPRTSTAAIRRAMNRIGINSPINVARFGRRDVRSLRDTFATKLRRGDAKRGVSGMSLDRLQLLLGHSSPQMTQKYADLGVDAASQEAVAALDQLTGG